jgi:hypothetical protein
MNPHIPQAIITFFLDPLPQLLPSVMPTLLHPSPQPPLIQQIPDLLSPLNPLINDRNREGYVTIRAALLILAGDIDESHTLVQNIATPHAAAWHAVIHRQEADFWNSNYWWRRTSSIHWPDLPAQLLPLLINAPPELSSWKSELAAGAYNPSRFTDLVERHHNNPSLTPTLLTIQRTEWLALLHDTLNHLTT